MLALTLLPTAAYATEGSTSPVIINRECLKCNKNTDHEILGYTPRGSGAASDSAHYIIRKCKVCGEESIVVDSDDEYSKHVPLDNREPTCTTGRICAKCGLEYGKLPHDWSAGVSNGDGTHTRTCQRDGCDAVDTANCGGDGNATCVNPGTCTGCGQQYYGEHYFAKPYTYGYNENAHWHVCSYCEEGREAVGEHIFVQGNMYLKSKATCISPPVYYENCSTCYYKGTNTYLHPWYGTDPKNHDGGTEVKDAKAATCTEKGYTGDTYCKGCGVKLSDGKDIPATGHDWADATCTTPKTCKVCKATEGNALGHKLTHIAAKNPTTFVVGNIEYWYCTVCGKYFRDAAATQEITKEATVTHKESAPVQDNKTVKSSKTGDAGVMLYAGMAVLSLTGCAWLRRKEK